MEQEEVLQIHSLIMAFMGTIHEKFFQKLRKHHEFNHQITKNQIKIISILYHYNNLTATELARMLDMEKGSLTTIIDQLQEIGLVIREIDPQDRRKLLLSLSPAGLDQMKRTMVLHLKILKDLFHNAEPEEIDHFVRNLHYVVEFTRKL